MSKIDIQDDFLNPNYFKNLKNLFLSEQVKWTYSDVISYENELSATKIDNFQFTHMVYFDDAPVSPHYNDLIDFINEIKVASTCKIKVNMNPKTDKIIMHGFHNDMVFKCKTGILYLNNNDGYTIFEDGTKVESIENRFVSFDSDMKHSGTSCTDQRVRLVININYFEPELHK